ncbi:MAG: hypothetical protein MJ237_01285 [bacterium]|nr:hypothetical protein [bacterium]
MSKKFITLFAVAMFMVLSSNMVQADTMFMDNVGKAHFVGNGGYGSIDEANTFYENAIRDSERAIKYNTKKDEKTVSNKEANNSDSADTVDAKYDFNPYTGDSSGVNETKTIYTDGWGRLHFFGKKNIIRY